MTAIIPTFGIEQNAMSEFHTSGVLFGEFIFFFKLYNMNNQIKKQVKYDDITIIYYVKNIDNTEKNIWEMDVINRQHFQHRIDHFKEILDPILKQKILQINEEKKKIIVY